MTHSKPTFLGHFFIDETEKFYVNNNEIITNISEKIVIPELGKTYYYYVIKSDNTETFNLPKLNNTNINSKMIFREECESIKYNTNIIMDYLDYIGSKNSFLEKLYKNSNTNKVSISGIRILIESLLSFGVLSIEDYQDIIRQEIKLLTEINEGGLYENIVKEYL